MLFFMKRYESDKRQKERTRLLRWKLGGLAALEQELPASSLQPKPKSNKKKQRHATQASRPSNGQKAVAAAVRAKRQKKQLLHTTHYSLLTTNYQLPTTNYRSPAIVGGVNSSEIDVQ